MRRNKKGGGTKRKSGNEHAPSWWKRLRRRIERAKAKDAMRRGKPVPQIKKNDDWEWF